MKVVLAGGSGFLGRALSGALVRDGHEVVVLGRPGGGTPTAGARRVDWQPDGTAGAWARELDGAGAVVNLAGAGIAEARWTAARKALLRTSRLEATTSLVAAVRVAATPPRVFLSSSGIGYYGAHGDEPLTEQAGPGDDFLARLVVEWEACAAPTASASTRLVLLRTGIVLGPEGGALAQMRLPFSLGVGGPLGGGRQWMSWVHRDDWVGLVRWLLDDARVRGAVNLTAPEPVTNAAFSRALGRTLRRPAFMPVPGVALRLLYGELADTLLTGQRVLPQVAQSLGYRFAWPTLGPALDHLLRR